MNDTPIEVIGSGFVPGIPGIYANTMIPAPDVDPADVSSPSPDFSVETPQILDTSVSPAQPRKAQAVKVTSKD